MANFQFENIIPWGQTGGDTGLSSRLKLQRNFDKIKTWADALNIPSADSFTAWGRTFWQNGQPNTIDGTLTDVENIEMTGNIIFNDNSHIYEDSSRRLNLFGYEGILAKGNLTVDGAVVINDSSNFAPLVVKSSKVSGTSKWTGIDFNHIINDTDTFYGGIRMDAVNGHLMRYNSSHAPFIVWDSSDFDPSDFLTSHQSLADYITGIAAGSGLQADMLTVTWNGGTSTDHITVPFATQAGKLKMISAQKTSPTGANYIDILEGTFAFSCDNLTTTGTDNAGLQVGYSVDKWQITALGGHLFIRQNDDANGTPTEWTAWRTVLDSANWTSFIDLTTLATKTEVNAKQATLKAYDSRQSDPTGLEFDSIDGPLGVSGGRLYFNVLPLDGGTMTGDLNLGAHQLKFQSGSIENTTLDGGYMHLLSQGGQFHFHGSGGTYGTCVAAAFTQQSDIRLKDVTRRLKLSVEDIAEAPMIGFTWKGDENGKEHVGSVAQYWRDVLPQAVQEDADGSLSMDYGTIALASAVTAARKAVALEQRVSELERLLATK